MMSILAPGADEGAQEQAAPHRVSCSFGFIRLKMYTYWRSERLHMALLGR